MEYMIKIANEILFMNRFIEKMKKDEIEFNSLLVRLEKFNNNIKDEARKYFDYYNKGIDEYEQLERDLYKDYDNNPTITKPGKKIILD
jgi:hypothetical protein